MEAGNPKGLVIAAVFPSLFRSIPSGKRKAILFCFLQSWDKMLVGEIWQILGAVALNQEGGMQV